MNNIYAERIEALRSLMRSHGWDAVIITGADPHCSEYISERWQQVKWLTGFTGEAGDVVVTLDHAGLWTDTRYFIQALKQLDGTGVELHKTRVPEQVLIPDWLKGRFDSEAVVAVDGLCQCASDAKELSEAFQLVSVPNMLDAFWKDRPGIPQTPVFTVETGESRSSKIDWLCSEIAARNCDEMLLTGLDDIAWLLNVRASDIDYNPLVISYLAVGAGAVKWFVLKDQSLDPESEKTFELLREEGVELLPYEDIELYVSELSGERVLVDANTFNWHLSSLLNCEVISVPSPVQLRKAVKNEYEIYNMRMAHVRDGVAMEKYLYWLEKSIQADKVINEHDAAVKLGNLRAEIEDYRGDSFETISAYGPGAALPHYITPVSNAPVLEPHGLYLCDSGGQYLSGTTDITRTVPLGECTELEIQDYTLVLKGHLALSMAIFPAGSCGCQIDAFARGALWQTKRNFGHGTGHGVGFFLGVHEGPQDIRQNLKNVPLRPGMILSDEPGIYREGLHGVRHENLVLVCDAGSNEFGKWLCFEPLTLCHFDTSCLDVSLLEQREIDYLNAYNKRVFETLCPYLSDSEAEWLEEKTAPVAKS